MKPLFWHILIDLKKPEEKTAGGIVLSEGIKEAELALTVVGQVSAIGPMAFTTKTPGGHDYSVHADDVKIGTWVLVSRKIGVPLRQRDGRFQQLVNDYEIMAVLTEEEAANIKAYI